MLLGALAAACSSRVAVDGEMSADGAECSAQRCATSPSVIERTARSFLADVNARRAALEESLLFTENSYAADRLKNYATLPGWDDLPVFDPEVARVSIDDAGTLIAGAFATWSDGIADHRVTNDGAANDRAAGDQTAGDRVEPTSLTATDWIAAGRAAFYTFPSQRFTEFESVARVGEVTEQRWLDAFGVWRDADARLSVTAVRYADGSTGLAYACATCHAQLNGQRQVRAGAPAAIDVRALARVNWGPGKVDVTADGTVNPVAVADLRATRVQSRLHHSGNVDNSLMGLAVRIETLLITNNHNAARPPRAVAFALAAYIWSLGEETARRAAGLERARTDEPRGAAIFEARCASCHQGEWGEGEWASVDAVGTEPLVATSSARGTGGYRVPALLGFQERPLTHEARRGGLEVWLAGDPDAADSEREGHAARVGGAPLTDEELTALVTYLRAAFPRDGE